MENREKYNESELLQKEAKRIEEDCIYSAKSHFNAEAVWKKWHYIIGIPAILTAVIISSMFLKTYLSERIIIIIGIIGAILTSLLTFLKPYEKANEHHNAGAEYLHLRTSVRQFRELEIINIDYNKAVVKLKEFADKQRELNRLSMGIPLHAFKKAKKGIENGEADYKIDK
jgi:hypothetical protein